MKTILILVLMSLSAAYMGRVEALETVPFVDVTKYLGTWYEIAKYPNKFQKDCGATRATYGLTKHGNLSVLNECEDLTKGGKIKVAKGVAFIADKNSNSKLKVGFAPIFKHLGLFTGDYWILKLDENYQHVLVGNPSFEYLWVLSRTIELPEETLFDLISYAEEIGFDSSRIELTKSF